MATTVVTQTGRAIITGRMIGATPSQVVPNRIGWGTGGATAAAVTQTTLVTESADEARATGTQSQVTVTTTNDTYQLVGTLTCATNPKTISEAGVFDAATGGNMLIRGAFTGQALNPGDSITFTVQTQISSS